METKNRQNHFIVKPQESKCLLKKNFGKQVKQMVLVNQ